MKAFSIRRNKHASSDSTTIGTEDPPPSNSSRSIYGSVISSSRPRNRLHKPHQSLDETHDPQIPVPTQVPTQASLPSPTHDITKRSHRKLVKKSRQHQRSDSSPEERGSVTPPEVEQKPHANSLPTTLRRSVEQPERGWSESESRAPSRGRMPLASMRHSVGSSADVLLTPIRGSTAIGDDFVFLPGSRVVETSGPDDITASPTSDRPSSPGPTIFTLLTDSETHHEVEHAGVAKPVDVDATVQEAALGGQNSSSSSELEGSDGSRPHSSLAETQTIYHPQLKINSVSPSHSELPTPTAPIAKDPLPLNSIVKCPVPKCLSPEQRRSASTRASSNTSLKHSEVHNVVPFPTEPDYGPWHSTLMQSDLVHEFPVASSESTLALWAYTIWQTVVGIMLCAIECYRWLVRKGLRNDLRSWVSYWFLRELAITVVLPLLLACVALFWFYRAVYPHYDLTPMTA